MAARVGEIRSKGISRRRVPASLSKLKRSSVSLFGGQTWRLCIARAGQISAIGA